VVGASLHKPEIACGAPLAYCQVLPLASTTVVIVRLFTGSNGTSFVCLNRSSAFGSATAFNTAASMASSLSALVARAAPKMMSSGFVSPNGIGVDSPGCSDQDLIRKRLEKAIVFRDRIEMILRQSDDSEAGAASSASTISIPFVPSLPLRKGLAHSPTRQSVMDEARRLSLLTAIARSRNRIETIVKNPALDFATIAKHEMLAERHVRFLTPLASIAARHSGHRGRPRAC